MLYILLLSPVTSLASNPLLKKLDEHIALRNHYSQQKEKKIARLRRSLRPDADRTQRLDLCNKLYEEYYTYRFDSAMAYADKMGALAAQPYNRYYAQLAKIHRALLLATSGLYSQSEQEIMSIDQKTLDPKLQYEYNLTAFWIYNYWSDYCRDNIYSPAFDRKRKEYLYAALQYIDKNTAQYHYLMGEYLFNLHRPPHESTQHYMKAIQMTTVDTRVYASSTYAVARNKRQEGDRQQYEDWLIRSAISDMICPLKENLALQELAMNLFRDDKKNAQMATQYIYISLADAQFYNNRLRMLEISKRLPVIVQAYQEQINEKNNTITFRSHILEILALFLLGSIVFMLKQNGKLNRRGKEIHQQNKELGELNAKLEKTNSTREKYLRLFMDLCAIYIGKLNNYRQLVARKIKANQTADLLKMVNSVKLTDNEASVFYNRFDRAFMELFPTFITEFNALLIPDQRLKLSKDGSLTTELRIFALIRLGVTESAEIATLLFYSPQTIYNYRSSIKKMAKNKERFEEDVASIGRFTQDVI